MNKFKAALFDLDGVVFDTEPQYAVSTILSTRDWSMRLKVRR